MHMWIYLEKKNFSREIYIHMYMHMCIYLEKKNSVALPVKRAFWCSRDHFETWHGIKVSGYKRTKKGKKIWIARPENLNKTQ